MLLLTLMYNVWFIDVNGPSATTKVIVMLNNKYSSKVVVLFGNSFIRHLDPIFALLVHLLSTSIVCQHFAHLNNEKRLKPINLSRKNYKQKLWSNSVIIKHWCEKVSKHGISTKLLWVQFKKLHIWKCNISISSSVCFAK